MQEASCLTINTLHDDTQLSMHAVQSTLASPMYYRVAVGRATGGVQPAPVRV
jgi:hypothetical protein